MLSSSEAQFTAVEFGEPGSLGYRIILRNAQGEELSPWNGVPLWPGGRSLGLVNCVCKTPKGAWAVVEVAEAEPLQPFKLLRRGFRSAPYAEVAPWNVGILPATRGDPGHAHPAFGGLAYDGGALEVLDLGEASRPRGAVYAAKPLAALAVLQKGNRLAWKVLAVGADDPMAARLHCEADIERELPGYEHKIREWLRTSRCLLPREPHQVPECL